nr:hypothetical protein GCM10020092_023210 [Actinoplanes digitatis]
MLLRGATEADLPGLLDVQEAGARLGLAHIFPQDVYPFPRSEVRARWVREMASPDVDVYVVVRQEGRVEGFAAVRGNQLLHFGTAVETWGGPGWPPPSTVNSSTAWRGPVIRRRGFASSTRITGPAGSTSGWAGPRRGG